MSYEGQSNAEDVGPRPPEDRSDRDSGDGWTPPLPPRPSSLARTVQQQSPSDQPAHRDQFYDDTASAADLLATKPVANGDSPRPVEHTHSSRFQPGNVAWKKGQAARIRKAVAVRLARLDRTRRLLRQLHMADCDLAVKTLRECMHDDDAKVRLAAVKLLFDTVSIKDAGEVDPTGDGKAPTFVFQIPVDLPVARRVVNSEGHETTS